MAGFSIVLAIVAAGLLGWLRLSAGERARHRAPARAEVEDRPVSTEGSAGVITPACPDIGTDAAQRLAQAVRAPLNTLSAFVTLLQGDGGGLPPRLAGALKEIADAEAALRAVLDDADDAWVRARGGDEAQERVLRRQRVDPQILMQRVCDDLSGEARARNVRLHRQPVLARMAAMADERRLQEALQLLIGQAIRHNRPGGAVVMGLARRDDSLVLTVADTGVGLTAARLEAMRQARPCDLVRARVLVEAMGGRLSLHGPAGEGLAVEILLPAADAPTPAASQPSPARPAPTLLHLSGDAASRLLMRRLAGGPRLHGAETVREALALARQLRPDVVLADDDADAALAVRLVGELAADPLTSETAVVLVADGLRPIDARRARRAGVAACLNRPVTPEALAIALDEALRARGALAA